MTAQSNITPESIVGDLRYLQLLSRSFPTIADASTEIINLEAILNLPKGTEHFLTDIHAVTETNSDKLRELLRNERRVELAFEGIRYWDLLRWKLAETVLVGEVWGAPYPKSITYARSTKFVDPTGHCRWYVGRRDFRNPQDYKWPIPLSEQNINPNLRE